MDFLSLKMSKTFLLFSFLLFTQLLPLIKGSASSSSLGRGRNSNPDDTGASSSGRVGQSTSNYLIPITVTRFRKMFGSHSYSPIHRAEAVPNPYPEYRGILGGEYIWTS